MTATKYTVRPGRGVYIQSGKFKGKFAVIVNIVDIKTILVDGPTTGVPRHVTHLNLLRLTPVTVTIQHTMTSKELAKVLESTKTVEKFNESGFAKKVMAKERRSKLNDFERFKYTMLKSKRSRMIKHALLKLKGKKPVRKTKSKPALTA